MDSFSPTRSRRNPLLHLRSEHPTPQRSTPSHHLPEIPNFSPTHSINNPFVIIQKKRKSKTKSVSININSPQDINKEEVNHSREDESETKVLVSPEEFPILQNKRKNLIDKQTFDIFIKKGRLSRQFSIISNSTKTNPHILQRGQPVDKEITSHFKKNKPTGKMYMNELWSQKYYEDITHSSQLAEQQEELQRMAILSAEEKEVGVSNLYNKLYREKEKNSQDLINKYKNDMIITKDDLLIKPGFDYLFASMKMQDSRNSSSSPKNQSPTRKSTFWGNQASKETSSIIDSFVGLSSIEGEDKSMKAFHFPSIDKDPMTLERRLNKANSSLLLRVPTQDSIISKIKSPKFETETTPSNIQNRHRNKTRLRRPCHEANNEGDFSTEVLLNFPNNLSHIIAKQQQLSPHKERLSPFRRQVEALDDVVSIHESFVPKENGDKIKRKSMLGVKIALKSLVQECEGFRKDQNLLKMVKQGRNNFGGSKVELEEKNKRVKLVDIRKRNLLEQFKEINESKKKREKSLGY